MLWATSQELRRLVHVALFTSASCGVSFAQTPEPAPLPANFVEPAPIVAVGEIEPAAASSLTASCETCKSVFDFKKIPVVRAAPRPGNFPNPPTGPGYYSILDAIRGDCLQGPPKYPYPRFGLMQLSFFDMSFAYLDDPKNTEHDWADPLKRIHVGDNWLLSLGGQNWVRSMNEYNSRLTAGDNNYILNRNRVYADLWYKDSFRFYVEGIASYTANQDLVPLPIDQTGPDFLNVFVDIKVAEVWGKPLYTRVGRQELMLGSQRLVSALDWSNNRRTFQGVSALRNGEKWDFTAFWLQPVIPNAQKLDWADVQQQFAGAWFTYRPKKGQVIDLYDIVYSNDNTVTQQGVQRGNFTINTTGARYAGDSEGFLWDVEGAMQLGRQAGNDLVAGMATVGIGYHAKQVAWNPTVWGYIDYASGDRNPRAGEVNTFNQIFPFGHYYLGWADLVGRQNIFDLNFHTYAYPTKWLTLNVQYHNFWLASRTDALYNKSGNISRFDPTGNSGRFVGNELDFITNFHITKHSDFLLGYSYMFAGEFLKNTAPAGTKSSDASTFFMQYNFRW